MSDSTDLVIVKLDSARLALMEARTIQDAKKVADVAKAMEVYSRQQKLGKEVEGHANAIFLEAMRRVGEMLQQTERATGGKPYQKSTGSDLVLVDAPPHLLRSVLARKSPRSLKRLQRYQRSNSNK